MHNKILLIKTIVTKIILVFLFSVIIIDFIKFDSHASKDFKYIDFDKDNKFSNTQIFGNNYIPNQIIINKLNKKGYNHEYNSLIKDYKEITITNNKKLIIIEEYKPLFYDKNYIYLSSGYQLDNNINILKKNKLIFLDLIINDQEKSYSKFIKGIEESTNYLYQIDTELYKKLESVKYSHDKTLSFFIQGCKVILSDLSDNKLSNSELKNKIDILSAFIGQSGEQINKIKEIDLRYDNSILEQGVILFKYF